MIPDVVGVMSDGEMAAALFGWKVKLRMRPDTKPPRTAQILGAIRSQRKSLFAEP